MSSELGLYGLEAERGELLLPEREALQIVQVGVVGGGAIVGQDSGTLAGTGVSATSIS